MGKITVDTAAVESLIAVLHTQQNRLQSVAYTAANINANLDIKTASSEGIRSSILSLQRRIQTQADKLGQYENFLRRVNDSFSAADKRVSHQAREVNYLLSAIKIQDITGETSAKNLSMLEEEQSIGKLNQLFGLAGTSVSASLAMLDSDILDEIWGALKDTRKGVGVLSDISDLYSVFGKSGLLEKLGEYGDAIKKSDFFSTVGYLSDAQKLYNAIDDNNTEDMGKLLEKYVKKIGKGATSLSGFEGAGYINLAWNFGENLTEGLSQFDNCSPVVGAAKYAWYLSGWTLLETGSEMAYDIVDSVYTIFGADLDKIYEDSTGTAGVEGFYKAMEEFGGYMKEGLEDEISAVGSAIEDGVSAVGDTVASWGKGIAGWFK